jgi:7-carboxy-7-deazaguanine synthase
VKRYALSPNPIFWSLQGEGRLRGDPMVFVRLAGCSVGCNNCDTDYRVDSRATVSEILDRVRGVTSPVDYPWVWITGGEPTDHDLRPLLTALKAASYRIAVASSGVRAVPDDLPIDWLSISPHSGNLQQHHGSEIKLVDRLGDLVLEQWIARWPDIELRFAHRYVQPLSVNGCESPSSLAHCMRFLREHPTWSLSRQDHVHWRVP